MPKTFTFDQGPSLITPSRVRHAAAWLLGLYLATIFVRRGLGRFEGGGWWVLVGGIEVAGGIALILPWLASYGGLALCVIMMGAWGTLAHDQRWTDVGTVTLYAVGLGWIAYEWWFLRLVRKPKVDRGDLTAGIPPAGQHPAGDSPSPGR